MYISTHTEGKYSFLDSRLVNIKRFFMLKIFLTRNILVVLHLPRNLPMNVSQKVGTANIYVCR